MRRCDNSRADIAGLKDISARSVLNARPCDSRDNENGNKASTVRVYVESREIYGKCRTRYAQKGEPGAVTSFSYSELTVRFCYFLDRTQECTSRLQIRNGSLASLRDRAFRLSAINNNLFYPRSPRQN